MMFSCLLEHNGLDSLLYCTSLPGAFTRGATPEEAMAKMPDEIRSYIRWVGDRIPESIDVQITQETESELNIRDADSDVLFPEETQPLKRDQYETMKRLVLKSAEDFQRLYDAVPDPDRSCLMPRKTFYGQVPRTARQMYEHTKNVNPYYFAEIGVEADHEGTVLECRLRALEKMEKMPGFLESTAVEGSYGECWSVRKVLRRFIWHDRIHGKAMYRMAKMTFTGENVPDVFRFES